MPVPPQSVRNNARRALRAREKAVPSKKAMTRTGLKRANDLANGANVSETTLNRMVSFLSRHRGNYQSAKAKGLKAEESKAIQSYLGWGGTSGLNWARSELRKLED